MTDRPILFSAPMVRVLLDGSKTQTRRLVKFPATGEYGWTPTAKGLSYELGGGLDRPKCPYAIGDRLYVRESIRWDVAADNFYYVDKGVGNTHYRRLIENGGRKSRPSIHMPRWASRLTLLVTDVRVQRLQDISEEDARAEGVGPIRKDGRMFNGFAASEGFFDLWDSINANRKNKDGNPLPYAWDDNPWVVAVSFDVHKTNIDQMGGAS